MVQKASDKLKDLLNRAVASELQAVIQYQYQAIMATGMLAEQMAGLFNELGRVEMGHLDEVAKRLFYFGGMPTIKPDPVAVGGSVEEMVDADRKIEEAAITLYKEIIAQAMEEGDETTEILIKEILQDEEGHHDRLITLQGRRA